MEDKDEEGGEHFSDPPTPGGNITSTETDEGETIPATTSTASDAIPTSTSDYHQHQQNQQLNDNNNDNNDKIQTENTRPTTWTDKAGQLNRTDEKTRQQDLHQPTLRRSSRRSMSSIQQSETSDEGANPYDVTSSASSSSYQSRRRNRSTENATASNEDADHATPTRGRSREEIEADLLGPVSELVIDETQNEEEEKTLEEEDEEEDVEVRYDPAYAFDGTVADKTASYDPSKVQHTDEYNPAAPAINPTKGRKSPIKNDTPMNTPPISPYQGLGENQHIIIDHENDQSINQRNIDNETMDTTPSVSSPLPINDYELGSSNQNRNQTTSSSHTSLDLTRRSGGPDPLIGGFQQLENPMQQQIHNDEQQVSVNQKRKSTQPSQVKNRQQVNTQSMTEYQQPEGTIHQPVRANQQMNFNDQNAANSAITASNQSGRTNGQQANNHAPRKPNPVGDMINRVIHPAQQPEERPIYLKRPSVLQRALKPPQMLPGMISRADKALANTLIGLKLKRNSPEGYAKGHRHPDPYKIIPNLPPEIESLRPQNRDELNQLLDRFLDAPNDPQTAMNIAHPQFLSDLTGNMSMIASERATDVHLQLCHGCGQPLAGHEQKCEEEGKVMVKDAMNKIMSREDIVENYVRLQLFEILDMLITLDDQDRADMMDLTKIRADENASEINRLTEEARNTECRHQTELQTQAREREGLEEKLKEERERVGRRNTTISEQKTEIDQLKKENKTLNNDLQKNLKEISEDKNKIIKITEENSNYNKVKAQLESSKMELNKEKKEKAEIEKSLKIKKDKTDENRRLLAENKDLRDGKKAEEDRWANQRKQFETKIAQMQLTEKEVQSKHAKLLQEIESLEKKATEDKVLHGTKISALEFELKQEKNAHDFTKMSTPQDKDNKISELKRANDRLTSIIEQKTKLIGTLDNDLANMKSKISHSPVKTPADKDNEEIVENVSRRYNMSQEDCNALRNIAEASAMSNDIKAKQAEYIRDLEDTNEGLKQQVEEKSIRHNDDPLLKKFYDEMRNEARSILEDLQDYLDNTGANLPSFEKFLQRHNSLLVTLRENALNEEDRIITSFSGKIFEKYNRRKTVTHKTVVVMDESAASQNRSAAGNNQSQQSMNRVTTSPAILENATATSSRVQYPHPRQRIATPVYAPTVAETSGAQILINAVDVDLGDDRGQNSEASGTSEDEGDRAPKRKRDTKAREQNEASAIVLTGEASSAGRKQSPVVYRPPLLPPPPMGQNTFSSLSQTRTISRPSVAPSTTSQHSSMSKANTNSNVQSTNMHDNHSNISRSSSFSSPIPNANQRMQSASTNQQQIQIQQMRNQTAFLPDQRSTYTFPTNKVLPQQVLNQNHQQQPYQHPQAQMPQQQIVSQMPQQHVMSQQPHAQMPQQHVMPQQNSPFQMQLQQQQSYMTQQRQHTPDRAPYAFPPPTNDLNLLENMSTEELLSRRGSYASDPQFRQEIILIDGVLSQRDRNKKQYQGGCDPRKDYYRDHPPDDDEEKLRRMRTKAARENYHANAAPYRYSSGKYGKNEKSGNYKGGNRRDAGDADSADEEIEEIASGCGAMGSLTSQFGDMSFPAAPSFGEDLQGNDKFFTYGEENEKNLQSGRRDDYRHYYGPTNAGGGGGGGGGGDDDDDGDHHDHHIRHRHHLRENTPPPPEEVTIFTFPSMDEVEPPYALKHAIDGNVCGGTSEHEDYKLIKGVTKEIDLDKCPAYMDEFLYFKRNINTFMEVTRAAISKKVTIYTMVAVLMLRTKRYHHIIKRLADKKAYYTSFRHFVRCFINEQWPNAKDRAMHLSQFCKQGKQSIEIYFESFVAIYEEFGTSLDDHVIKFIDGLSNATLRERVRCNDYQSKTLMTVREYSIRTWQNMEAEMACRNKSFYNKSSGNRTGNGYGRQQRSFSQGRGRGRGRGGFRGRGRGASNNTIASIRAAPSGNPRGRSKSYARAGARGGRGAKRSSSAPGRSASRGNANRGRSRSANRGGSNSRGRSSNTSTNRGRTRSSSAGNRRAATPHAKIAALDSTSKREEALQVARRLKLKGCVGCAGAHKYFSFFRDCHGDCPFCKKTFTRNDNRHLAMLCRSMPKEKSEILKKIWAARDNRE